MPTAAVTGATSYTGRFIADRLLGAGWSLVNLTRRPSVRDLAPPAMRDVLFPADDGGLARALEGVEVL
jgi:NAD(P)-dependent dehydrogenase (short-subunit alcohol dehydrogenase family)